MELSSQINFQSFLKSINFGYRKRNKKVSVSLMKCAVCGKKAVVDGLCADCYAKKHPILKIPKNIDFKVCPQCGRIFHRNRWVKIDFYDAVEQAILNSVKADPNYKKVKINIKVFDGYANVHAEGVLGNKLFKERTKCNVNIQKELCNICSKSYEAVLQLRGESDNVEDMQAYVEGHLKEGARIVRIKAVRNGTDIYLNSRNFAVSIARALFKNFGGEIKITKSLYGVDHLTSKKLYRTFVLIRAFPFSVGDVIKDKNKIMQIRSFDKLIRGTDLKTGKKINMPLSDKMKVVEKEKTVVAQRKPELKVIHPYTFQAVTVKNSKIADVNEECTVVVDNGYVYLVPL